MKTIAIAVAAVTAAASGAALAKDRVSDAAYLQAARCHGLAAAVGAPDQDIAAFLRQAQAGRLPAVVERADTAFSSARRSGAKDKLRAQAELDRACVAYRAPAATPAG